MRVLMSPRRRQRTRILAIESPSLGFQIAPMIDVVFVIMLFFMIMAGALRAERRLSLHLPGPVGNSLSAAKLPTELLIGIDNDDLVTLNEEAIDDAFSHHLPETRKTLRMIQQMAKTDGGKVLTTIQAQPEASYERIIAVLNALNSEGLHEITFAVGAD